MYVPPLWEKHKVFTGAVCVFRVWRGVEGRVGVVRILKVVDGIGVVGQSNCAVLGGIRV